MSRALLLTREVPWPSNSGGRIREAEVASLLRRRFDEVHVLAFGEQPPPHMLPAGVFVHAVRRPNVLAGSLRGRSVAVGKWYSSELQRSVAALTGPEVHLHVGSPQMMVNVPDGVRVNGLDLHNVESDLLAQRGRRHPRTVLRPLLAWEASRLAAWERRVTRDSFVTCVTEQDQARLHALGIRAVVARNGTTIPATVAPVAAEESLVFVGALNWAPNVESLVWFRREVWPLIRAKRPSADLALVGRAPGPDVLALAGGGVVVAGDVPSVTPYYAGSRIAVCPLLTGGGSRLKIVEALGHGRPVVSTALGAEGLEELVGQGIVLAEEPEEFADVVADLLNDPERCSTLGALGRAAVQASWSWETTLAPMEGGIGLREQS